MSSSCRYYTLFEGITHFNLYYLYSNTNKGGTPTGYILGVRPNGGSIRYLIHSDSVDMIYVSDNSEIYEYLVDLLSN